jgi:hypothetical protein
MNHRILMCAVGASVLLSGCSSRPREFTPTLGAGSADQARFEAAQAECRTLFVEGKLDKSGRLASAGAGAAAGTAVAVGGTAAASSAGLYGGMAVASATIVALPFVAVAGAWGLSRAKRARKEKAVKMALGGCLRERGYEVSEWTKAPKAKKARKAAASENQAAQ